MKKENPNAKTLEEKVEAPQEANVEESTEEKVEAPQEANVEESTEEKVEAPQEVKPESNSKIELDNYMVINCKNLNVRKKPSKDSDVITVLPLGTVVSVKAVSDNGWARVYLSDGEKGYVMLEFIKEI